MAKNFNELRNKMSGNQLEKSQSLFEQINNLVEIDAELLIEYQKEMEEKVIPEIIESIKERNFLVQESRNRIL